MIRETHHVHGYRVELELQDQPDPAATMMAGRWPSKADPWVGRATVTAPDGRQVLVPVTVTPEAWRETAGARGRWLTLLVVNEAAALLGGAEARRYRVPCPACQAGGL